MPLVNTLQPYIRDKTAPTLVVDPTKTPSIQYGTLVVDSGLTATSGGFDVSSDIVIDAPLEPNTFVEGGSVVMDFRITNAGGNSAFATVDVPIVGSAKYPFPALWDFSELTEIPTEFNEVRGTWGVVNGALIPTGAQPSSPRWNIIVDGDGDGDFQIEFKENVFDELQAILVRYVNSTNYTWVFHRGGIVTAREVVDGVQIGLNTSEIPVVAYDQPIVLGVKIEGYTLTVYHGSEILFDTYTTINRYARGFGILSLNDNSTFSRVIIGQAGSITFGEFGDTTPTPTISISASPSDPIVGELITFTATTTNADSISWVSEGLTLSSSSGNSVTATATRADAYVVSATATGNGQDVIANITVMVPTSVSDFISAIVGNGRFDEFYQNTNNSFIHIVTDKSTGAIIPASTFSDVEYYLYDKLGRSRLKLTLNNGITVENDIFIVSLPAGTITIEGRFDHQFIPIGVDGEIYQPSFDREVRVRRTARAN